MPRTVPGEPEVEAAREAVPQRRGFDFRSKDVVGLQLYEAGNAIGGRSKPTVPAVLRERPGEPRGNSRRKEGRRREETGSVARVRNHDDSGPPRAFAHPSIHGSSPNDTFAGGKHEQPASLLPIHPT